MVPEDEDDERTSLLGRKSGSGRVGVVEVAALSYFSSCGGPFGLELAVGAVGPVAVIGAVLALALVWALPAVLMTAELGSALPSRSGYLCWVTRAFGSRMGAFNGWCSLLSSFVDSSTYPSMFCDYLCFGLRHWFGVDLPLGAAARWAIGASVTLLVCGLNMLGLEIATKASVGLAVATLMPFVVMAGLAVPRVLSQPLLTLNAVSVPSSASPDWLLLLSIGMW